MGLLKKLAEALYELATKDGQNLAKEGTQQLQPVVFIVNIDNSTNYGTRIHGSVVVQGNLTDAFNTINNIKDAQGNRQELSQALEGLHKTVEQLIPDLPEEDAERASRDLKSLVDEAASKKPRKNFLEISGKGLVDAAKTVAKMAGPVTSAVKAVLDLFTN